MGHIERHLNPYISVCYTWASSLNVRDSNFYAALVWIVLIHAIELFRWFVHVLVIFDINFEKFREL